ncbi:hypothetical protein ABT340_39360, partial [Streptosporangium sp. NPDC000239]|uniref:hypothetical protein n=1 Tax=Streptosporangium sp. NPDC000239 TaxID=3154248 RepID=UPI00332455E4
GQYGDQLQFGGRHCVDTFVEAVTALACLSWMPGGVTFAGLHFCVRHEECHTAAAESAGRC